MYIFFLCEPKIIYASSPSVAVFFSLSLCNTVCTHSPTQSRRSLMRWTVKVDGVFGCCCSWTITESHANTNFKIDDDQICIGIEFIVPITLGWPANTLAIAKFANEKCRLKLIRSSKTWQCEDLPGEGFNWWDATVQSREKNWFSIFWKNLSQVLNYEFPWKATHPNASGTRSSTIAFVYFILRCFFFVVARRKLVTFSQHNYVIYVSIVVG